MTGYCIQGYQILILDNAPVATEHHNAGNVAMDVSLSLVTVMIGSIRWSRFDFNSQANRIRTRRGYRSDTDIDSQYCMSLFEAATVTTLE